VVFFLLILFLYALPRTAAINPYSLFYLRFVLIVSPDFQAGIWKRVYAAFHKKDEA